MQTNMLVTITVAVMGALLIGGITNSMVNNADSQSGTLNNKLGSMHREITLKQRENPAGNEEYSAEQQFRAATTLITLRSINCRVLASYIRGTGGKWDKNDYRIPGDLRPAAVLDDKSISRLQCKGSKSAIEVVGGESAAAMARGDLVDWAVESLWDSNDEIGFKNDQEGNVGNVKFTLSADEDPLVIDGSSPLLDKGMPIDAPKGAINTFFWHEDAKTFFAPDPNVARWTGAGDEVYAVTPYTPSMINVPMVNRTPVKGYYNPPSTFETSVSLMKPTADYIDESGLPDEAKNVLCTPGSCNPVTTKEKYYSDTAKNEYASFNKLVGGVLGFTGIEKGGETGSSVKGVQEAGNTDYEFVLCPGVEGRIQSNAGEPRNAGEGKEGMTYGENTVFPFVQVTGLESRSDNRFDGKKPDYCLEKYDLGSEDWNRQKDVIDKDKRVELTCNGFVDARISAANFQEGKTGDHFKEFDAGSGTYQARCGLNDMPLGTTGNYLWSPEIYVREKPGKGGNQ